ncbi:uncharacterized protein LOC124882456, partial [Girardinichthys multiradiatus]|uniref:uncharacterized protein LOC124882456 n=1 Tax=Girardinichthys multiradiatus TaxID=208333 RepID=UPI001FACBA88
SSSGVTAGTSIYHLPGDNGILPCNSLPSFSSCSNVNWIYNPNVNTVNITVVEGGNVKSSQQSARLNVDSNCSLIITNIAPEDAGCYTCHHGEPNNLDAQVFLNILTIYLSPPHNGPAKDGDLSLECTLWRHFVDGSCPKKSLRWVDETETVLLAEYRGYCVSLLTLKNHHEGNRRYTCRFFEGNSMKIEGHYKSVFKDPAANQPILITIAVMIVVVLMLVIIAAIFLKRRRRRTRLPDDETYTNNQNPTSQSHRYDFNVAYASIDHSKSKGSRKKKAKEEEDTVYYSTIRTNVDISTAVSLNQDTLNRK